MRSNIGTCTGQIFAQTFTVPRQWIVMPFLVLSEMCQQQLGWFVSNFDSYIPHRMNCGTFLVIPSVSLQRHHQVQHFICPVLWFMTPKIPVKADISISLCWTSCCFSWGLTCFNTGKWNSIVALTFLRMGICNMPRGTTSVKTCWQNNGCGFVLPVSFVFYI